MSAKSAEFIKGIIGTDEILTNGRFQVAFLGRSNVGKSSLINSITNRINLAHSSSSPGKTIRMDFFLINNAFYFVDFPGYGYARHSPEVREKLAKMILWYIMYSEIENRLIVLVIDAKVGFTAYDIDMIKTFKEHNVKYIVVANKIDNLKMGQKEKRLQELRKVYPDSAIIPYSSVDKRDKTDLMNTILEYTKQ
jgi:GTP-binding protein